jgi:3-methyl-2-oxobutanoate hydroxymethyltransferase
MADKVTAPKVRAMKGKRIVCITAYDAPFAALAEEAGVDLVLVGDSLGNAVLGYESTLPVTLDEMLHHTRAVRRGLKRALLVADLPFGAYQASVEQAVNAAVACVKAGAEAVKLEGGYVEAVAAIVRAGIPVMAHVGFTPQSLNLFGGFRVQGRGNSAEQVLEEAIQLDRAGVFAMVLELVPADLARKITDAVACPTIGIGAGVECDGQIQVMHDVLGLTADPLRHAKAFIPGRDCVLKGIRDYAEEVRSGAFPAPENSF